MVSGFEVHGFNVLTHAWYSENAGCCGGTVTADHLQIGFRV